MDLARYARRVEEEVLERLVLHAVLAAHLLDEELRVGDDLELVDTRLDRALESGDQGRVFGHVVRRNADPSPRASSTVPSSASSTKPYAAGPGLPREPPSVKSFAFITVDQCVHVVCGLLVGMRAASAATTSSRRCAGTTVSTRSSGTCSSLPLSPTAGSVPSSPRNVPVPAVYQEQRS